jgi:hypothetical protein
VKEEGGGYECQQHSRSQEEHVRLPYLIPAIVGNVPVGVRCRVPVDVHDVVKPFNGPPLDPKFAVIFPCRLNWVVGQRPLQLCSPILKVPKNRKRRNGEKGKKKEKPRLEKSA